MGGSLNPTEMAAIILYSDPSKFTHTLADIEIVLKRQEAFEMNLIENENENENEDGFETDSDEFITIRRVCLMPRDIEDLRGSAAFKKMYASTIEKRYEFISESLKNQSIKELGLNLNENVCIYLFF